MKSALRAMYAVPTFLIALFLFCSSATVSASENIKQGVSLERLQAMANRMQTFIDDGRLVGMSTLVARNGEVVHFSQQGLRDRENNLPMTDDTIFRIYSMTKPITAVAALTLWEQGKFQMHDPITKYIPEFADLKVYVSGAGEDMVLEDMQSPIRIIDLFLHTAGFSYGFTASEVDKLYRQSFPKMQSMTTDEAIAEIAALPLHYQPGTRWHYGVNTDVIGFLVERITGKKLGEYMQEVIFSPLGMNDTGFYVRSGNVERFAAVYGAGEKGETLLLSDEPLGDFLSDPVSHNGGGGLVSTMQDYFVFAQMLLNKGEYNGVRILGKKTVEYMTTNHLPEHLVPFSPTEPGTGYGLAMSVVVSQSQLKKMGSVGTYSWGGAAATTFRIDPVEKLIMIAMTQFMPSSFHPYQDDFNNTVYQALVD